MLAVIRTEIGRDGWESNPAIEGLVRDADSLASLGNRESLALERLVLSQFGHDLLHRVPLSCCHFPPPVLSRFQGLSEKMDQFSGSRTLEYPDGRSERP